MYILWDKELRSVTYWNLYMRQRKDNMYALGVIVGSGRFDKMKWYEVIVKQKDSIGWLFVTYIFFGMSVVEYR